MVAIWSAVLPILVPYITEVIKKILSKMRDSYPIWFKPLRPILAGCIIAAISKLTGVALPSDLMQLTDGNVMAILSSGTLFGAVGGWIYDLAKSVQTHYGPDSIPGELVRLFLGEAEPKKPAA